MKHGYGTLFSNWRKGPHLARDGKTVGPISAFNDASDVLYRCDQRCELVVFEVSEARHNACGYDEDVYWRRCENPARGRTRSGEAGHRRPGTMGLRLTMAAASRER